MHKQAFVLFLLVIIALSIPFFSNNLEGYSNYNLNQAVGNISASNLLVSDTYQTIGSGIISDNSASDIWQNYPLLGSYEQITNNIRYPNNPDDGSCMPASMCDALYQNKYLNKSNVVEPLPPANDNGTRIGYFSTNVRLIDSLLFKSDLPNILY